MSEFFSNYGFLRLDNFLEKQNYESVLRVARKLRWQKLKQPDLFSYSLGKVNKDFVQEFEFEELANFIARFVKFKEMNLKLKLYSHRDYTLVQKKNLKAEFFIYFPILAKPRRAWEDRFGGYKCYVDSEGKSLIFPVKKNSFALLNGRHFSGFTKYVNHLATKSSLFVVEGEVL
ncbi:hypothetical protein D6817_00765 [Candidatus Pacearchaeota archaeon]|nr:MAG: hypothetical protein D6817_00765 [Candidatus Pacearchaeota archaeon]